MALQQSHNFKGYTGDYWRINGFRVNDIENKRLSVTLALYKDQATRQADIKDFVSTETRIITIPDLDGNIREQAYQKMMAEKPTPLTGGRVDFTKSARV